MDDGRVFTIEQKGTLLFTQMIKILLVILDMILWAILGRPKLLLWIAFGLTVSLALIITYSLMFVLFQRLTPQYTVTGKRKIKRILFPITVLVLWFAGRCLIGFLPVLGEIFTQMSKPAEAAKIAIDLHIPVLNLSVPDIQLGFWPVLLLIICMIVVICAFFSRLLRGIVALPVMGAYSVLFLAACGGWTPENASAFLKLLGAAAAILLVSGILLRRFGGFGVLLSLVRYLVPFTMICLIAIYLTDTAPASAPPLNFRGILFWGWILVFFLAQSCQFLGLSLPDRDYSGADRDPVADMIGNECTGTLDIYD